MKISWVLMRDGTLFEFFAHDDIRSEVTLGIESLSEKIRFDPEEFRTRIKADLAKWTETIKAAGVLGCGRHQGCLFEEAGRDSVIE